MARPSRTQQLLNPKLMPKLSNENPNQLLESTGVADDLLAKREQERGRKRDLEDTTDPHSQSPKRARSISSHSMSSISTISTNRSYSTSPRRSKRDEHESRRGSTSPPPTKSRKRRYSDSSEGRAGSVHSSEQRPRSISRERTDDRNTRRRRRESSPEERGRHRAAGRHSLRRDRRSRSVDKARVPKEKRSPTPDGARDRHYRDRASPPRQSQPAQSRQDTRMRNDQPPRERSLSPFSKRLALTQAMNHGR
ncbi:hypothetical protein PENANT_c012G02151 [Penicillium antarcticum]|uniref:Uncharacterized protein n=1 Tax=Penicillium antarcticum TaxID=416450 RepID=A0A1V6Q5P5_9EURO|nr:uncharacterized protein N7508_008172 [Penicillium antarcticum]KAJ5297923.1 hypothetical protein N7508_008172 [Penicillium antarcticum]OQD84561.1 hypothetical protein PENANT_c012G02151 [Penicillium antarcticum]